MDGLECNEALKSSIVLNTLDFRLDTSLYKKTIVEKEKAIKLHCHFYLKRQEVFTGPFGSTLTAPSHMKSGFIPLVRSMNINQGFYIDRNNLVYITEEDNERIKHSQLFEDDIVLSRVGSIGYFARVDSLLKTCNISSNNIGIRLDNYERSIKHYILTFLNTKTANQLVGRLITGNVQPKLTTKDMCLVPIPAFSSEYYALISKLIDKSEDAIVRAEEGYIEAERILATVIDIQNISQSSPVKAEKYLSDSFGKTDRLDAEYYQPKYDTLFEALANVNTKKLGGIDGIVSIMKSLEPGSDVYVDEGIPFVRVSDVSKFEITDPEIKLDSKAISAPDKLFPKKDTILFSKDGSVGIAYKVDADMKVITSGALLHLTVRDTSEVLPDYLTLVLNSPAVQLQAERDSNGAIIQHWKSSEIENVVVPVLDMEIQKEIATKVQDSFALRKKSKQLLEYAKQAVEMAIEQGEDIALAWLKDKVN